MEWWCIVRLSAAVVAMVVVTATVPTAADISTTEPPSENVDDHLVVGSSSHLCDWTRAMGPVCNYNTTTQVVVVPEGLEFSSGQLELEIHDPAVVQLYPTCVSWIQVYNAGMINTLPAERNLDCRTWLRVYHSKAGRVEYGVKDLTLLNSEVETIKLFDQRDFMAINSSIREIEELDWGGYRATVLNTSIGRLAGVQARDSWYVVGGRFGSVATGGIVFNAREMSVINSTIKHMSAKSLIIKRGTVTFANVSINYLEAEAITVSSPTGFLSLANITIGAANAPCFVLPDRERVSLYNVTVLGIPINLTSPFLHFIEDTGANSSDYMIAVREGREECVSNATALYCDFVKTTEKLEVRGEEIQQFQQVEVHNANSLLVTSTACRTELRLESVNATLPHLAPLPAGGDENTSSSTSGNTDSCNATVIATNSSLNVVWARHMKSLNVTDSAVKRLHGGRLNGFLLAGSTVEEMDDIEVVGRGAKWSRSSFPGSISVTLKAPLEASAINLLHLDENSLIIDHPGKTTIITGWRLGRMRRHSMIIKNGSHVELSFVMADRMAQEAIFLEEGASASAFHILQDSVYIFSVAHANQVNLQNLPANLIHVRAPPRSADHESNFTVSDTHISAYCRTIPYYLQICDFTSAPQVNVTVDLANGQVSNRVIIKGASTVLLFPSCVEKIILMNVKKASTVESDRECGTWLEAFGVHMTNLTSGVHDVTLKSCTVDLLAPDRRLRDVDLEGTSVKLVVGVHWAGYTGVFNNSRLGEVESLRADSRLMMSNSTVDTLLLGGMFLAAEAIIVNTTFKEIRSYGMTVNGSTRMQDVTIEKLHRRGIKVLDGLLLLVNVRILEAEHESITADINGGISFQNVTVGGKKVHWRGYLTKNESALKQSVVFLNKPYNESDATMTESPEGSSTTTRITSTTSTTTTTQPGQPSPQASSRVQWRGTTTGDKAMSSEAPHPLEGPAPTSSWKWAGAGIGFCMGLLVGFCIFIAIKVIKPNKGMLTLPTVFWRVKDDQHELLQEDQVADEPTGARRDQGYSALPRSDV